MTVRFEDTDPRPISPHDQKILDEFRDALAQPTRHATVVALLRMDSDSPDVAEALAKHDSRCCARCERHVMPHRGCILR
jgi:hypothetical protein